ncbi:MAG: ABC transporter ATP-binding protein [Desulfobacteraceae bacterium]|nr:ABC transporter ATP-binding protein [Desulfobacteraceae bacterium]
MTFFQVQNLSLSFGGLAALSDVSFEVDKGEIYAVIGPNGAGKTTLFNCISGLYRPDQGRIHFNDRRIDSEKPDRIARLGIGRTFQNIELFVHLNTMENILLGRHLFMRTGLFRGIFMWGRRSFAGKEEITHRRKVEEIIDFLNLQAVRDKPVGMLPYGTRKLVELGRSLAVEPDLLLLDEPCAGMTADEKQDLYFHIHDIRDILGTTIVLIEHDMNMVMDISNRILAVNFGKTITEGVPEMVQRHPDVLKAYLGED